MKYLLCQLKEIEIRTIINCQMKMTVIKVNNSELNFSKNKQTMHCNI